jgi:hypothetical protein
MRTGEELKVVYRYTGIDAKAKLQVLLEDQIRLLTKWDYSII